MLPHVSPATLVITPSVPGASKSLFDGAIVVDKVFELLNFSLELKACAPYKSSGLRMRLKYLRIVKGWPSSMAKEMVIHGIQHILVVHNYMIIHEMCIMWRSSEIT